MKIKKREVTETEIDIALPCYRKDDLHVVMIISEDEFIQASVKGTNFHHYKGTMGSLWTVDFLSDRYVDATQEEFNDALYLNHENLLADVQNHLGMPV